MPLFKEVEKKNRLLRSVAGSGVEQLGELVSRWDKYKDMMESHQENIKDQVRERRREGGVYDLYLSDESNEDTVRVKSELI